MPGLKGYLTGIKANEQIDLDEDGFENVDKFWEGVNDKSPRHSTKTNFRKSIDSDDDDNSFNYDTSDSITIEDESTAFEDDEDTADESELQNLFRKPAFKRGTKDSRDSATDRQSTDFMSYRTSITSSLALEDSFQNSILTDKLDDSFNNSRSASKLVSNKKKYGVTSADKNSKTPSKETNKKDSASAISASKPDFIRLNHNLITNDSPPIDFMSAIKPDDGEVRLGDDVDFAPDFEEDGGHIKNRSSSTSKRRVSFNIGLEDDGSNKEDMEYFDSKIKSPKRKTPIPKKSNNQTPGSTHNITISTPGSNDFPRGRILPDETFDEDLEDSDDEDQEGETDQSGFTNSSFMDSIRRKNERKRARARGDVAQEDSTDQDDDEEEDDYQYEHEMREDGLTVRRSKRATKGVRCAFWKNERPLYEKGKYVGILRADQTPRKSVKKNTKNGTKMRRLMKTKYQSTVKDGENEDEDDGNEVTEEDTNLDDYPQIELPAGNIYINRSDEDGLWVWDDHSEEVYRAHVFCSKESLMPPSSLPITSTRRTSNRKVGRAAQYFNMQSVHTSLGPVSGFIAGFVELPPGAIKDEEMVGEYVQVFFATDCQDLSVELALGDPTLDTWVDDKAQRVLLKRGDSFFVLPGNTYRLENYSKSKTCMIHWTIIRPTGEDSGSATAAPPSTSNQATA